MAFRIALMITLLSLFLLGVWAAKPASTPNPARQAQVSAILAGIDLAQTATRDAAEAALVMDGTKLLPAMDAALVNTRGTIKEMQNRQRNLGDIPLLQTQADVLDRAIIRITWKINPPALIQQWVNTHMQAPESIQLPPPARITDDQMAMLFPAYLFYLVRFRQYPVARSLPEPLTANNIFVVSRDGIVRHLTDVNGLETFFKNNLPRVNQRAAAKTAISAWLRLAQEFVQDGMFQFTIPTDRIIVTATKDAMTVTGAAVVVPNGANRGEVTANMTFTGGKLVRVEQTSTVKAGMRPICQATKLLDPDPIVRRMAEQNLLIMGAAAEAYIIEQREKASPELQAAIDQMWARMQLN